MPPSLHVVMYHYVRDLPNTPFPKIKGMPREDFCQQLTVLEDSYEMATLESALDFIEGTYSPARDMCLLTFDDGLKEHYADITPLLVDRKLQGLFFVITSCLEGGHIAPVHMNHFLMAALDFEEYRKAYLDKLADMISGSDKLLDVDMSLAQHTYRWDTPEVAAFKYLFNFVLDFSLRDKILKGLFEEKIGDVNTFGRDLYLNAHEAKQMQVAGMIIGGHSHEHRPLSSLSDEELACDLSTCHRLLTERLYRQPLWPFCYPYGKKDSFKANTSERLKQIGFACSFSTELGSNGPGADAFTIRRLDCRDVRA